MKFSFYIKRRRINLRKKLEEGKWKSWDHLKEWCSKQDLTVDITESDFESLLPKKEQELQPEVSKVVEDLKPENHPEPDLEDIPTASENEDITKEIEDYSKLSARKLREELKDKGLKSFRLSKKEMVEKLNNLSQRDDITDDE
jgi:hypothetical protein